MPIIDSYTTYTSSSQFSSTMPAMGQSFTGNGKKVSHCCFFGYANPSATGTLTAKLYAHSGSYGTTSVPDTGNLLATSQTVDVSTLPGSSNPIDIIFRFLTPYTTVNGTKYVITFEYTNISGTVVIYLNTTSVHSGNTCTYTTSWGYASDYDLYFIIYDQYEVGVAAVGTPVAGTTSTTPTIPTGVQVGDLMIIISYHHSGSADWTCSCSEGWTEELDSLLSTYGNYAIYSRVYQNGDGNPTVTPSVSNNHASVILAFYNQHASSIFDVAINTVYFYAPTTPFDVTLSAFSTSTNGAMAVLVWGSYDDNTWVYRSGGAVPQISYDWGSNTSYCIATKGMSTAGSIGDQIARETNKAGDLGRELWFAVKPQAEVSWVSGGSLSNVIIV